jgi:hypothetical protein
MSVIGNAHEQSRSLSPFELEIGAATAAERRALDSKLLACDSVSSVVSTARDDVPAALFRGDPHDFRTWARALAPQAA